MTAAALQWMDPEEREQLKAEIKHELVEDLAPILIRAIDDAVEQALADDAREHHAPPLQIAQYRRLYVVKPVTEFQLHAMPSPSREEFLAQQPRQLQRLDPMETVEESPDDAAWKMDHPEAN